MKILLIAMLAALFALAGTVNAAPATLEEKVAGELAVYQEALDLSEEQASVIEDGLTQKISIGQEAYQLKKAGDDDKGKEMNQQAGKAFYQLMRETLTKDQWKVYRDNKDEIKEAVKASRK
jgi:hypothetical protein